MSPKRIITLSTIPPRFPYLEKTLASLAAQESIDKVIIYIPRRYKRFGDYNLDALKVSHGVELHVVDTDYGPATKILPAIDEFSGTSTQLLFCDDDLIYPPRWAKNLFDIQSQRPSEAVATIGRINATQTRKHDMREPRAVEFTHSQDIPYRSLTWFSRLFGTTPPLWRPIKKAGYIDILFGVGGAVVRPDFFDAEVFEIPEIAWPVDDIWLSAQLAKKQVPIFAPKRLPCPPTAAHSTNNSLLRAEFEGMDRQELNNEAIHWCQDKYNIWL